MKRQFILSITALCAMAVMFVTGCDKIPGGVVDFRSADYKVTNIVAPSSVVYAKSDSSIVISAQLTNTASVASVWCTVTSIDGTIDVMDRVNMNDDGNTSGNGDVKRNDGIYTGKFFISRTKPNGQYQIEFYVEDNVNQSPDNVAKVGSAVFNYDNGQNNLPPIISNLVLSASVNRGDTFVFTVKADDPNGAADISQVYFRLYRPDGTLVVNSQGISNFPMFDDGNTSSDGDQTAGDGIYSVTLNFPADQPVGIWKFEFQAKDRNGTLSNLITQNMTVN